MSYANLIPDELQSELILLRDAHTRIDFRTGDVVALILDYNRENENPVGVMEVYQAVGAFVGRSSRTVRDYHTVSCFYTHEVREQYTVLAFDHFRQAMALGPDWELALKWAVEQVDELGRPASVDAMIAQFSATGIDESSDDVGEDVEQPEDQDPAESEDAGAQVRAALLVLRRNLAKLELSRGEMEQVEEALGVLEGLLVGTGA